MNFMEYVDYLSLELYLRFLYFIYLLFYGKKIKINKIYGCFGWKNIVEYIIV